MPFDNTPPTINQTNSVLEALRHARDLIAQGWTQKAYEWDGGFCLLGALRHAIPDSKFRGTGWVIYCDAVEELRQSLPEDRQQFPVHWYNDQPGRTQSDILNLFDRAIKQRKSKAS